MDVKPEKEHAWLAKLAGEWTYETDADAGADSAPAKGQGTQVYRALGDYWIVGDNTGEMPGCGPFTAIITLGFDPKKKRFAGTWIGSMMSHLWVYDGELDATGKS